MAHKKMDWLGGILSVLGLLGLSLLADTCMAETSYEFGSAQSGIHDCFELSSETVGTSARNPIGTAGVLAIASLVASTTGGEPEWILVLFRKDSIPYSRIEKRAADVFNAVHRGTPLSLSKSAIIAKQPKACCDFKKLFWTAQDRLDVDKLAAMEDILTRIADGHAEN